MALQNQDAITRFFAGKGLTAAQIAGIEGNIQIESGGNPAATNPREGAVGIAQWEGARLTGANGLQAYARSSGGSSTDLATQLNFYWQELQTTESGALQALLAATTPAAAATAIQSKYERSSTSSLQARIDAANAIAGGGVQGGSGTVQNAGLHAANAGFDWNPLNWPADVFSSAVSPALGQLGRWVVDGLVIIVGLVLVVLAFVLLAKAGSSSTTTVTLAPAAAKGGRAEEAAEVAA